MARRRPARVDNQQTMHRGTPFDDTKHPRDMRRTTVIEEAAVKRELRSNLERGGTIWAGRRAQWRALGLSEADMEKPRSPS